MCVWSRSCVCSGFEEARCVRGVGGVCALCSASWVRRGDSRHHSHHSHISLRLSLSLSLSLSFYVRVCVFMCEV